jgi:hypothetical protein
MPAHTSRRARLVLLAFALLTFLTAGAAAAKTPFTINKVTEGDPGDGVLRPQSYDSPPFLGPEPDDTQRAGGTAVAVDIQDYSTGAAPAAPLSSRRFVLPTTFYVPGLGWAVLTPLWLIDHGGWTHAF